MAIHIARKTVQAIDNAIKADGGDSYRSWLQKVLPHIGDAYRQEGDDFRTHLGASVLGNECARVPWYNFRWTSKGEFDGRILRLFNRGHLEEARFIAMLLTIGCEVLQQDENGKQFRVKFANGHGGGSGDGVVRYLPDLGDTYALSEFKTHNDKSFTELAGKPEEWRDCVYKDKPFTGKGVRETKFEHYVQMQIYMRLMELPVGLYMAVNKNTDDLYAELVMLDTTIADEFIERGRLLAYSHTPPNRLGNSAGFWKCRFCEFKAPCHLRKAPLLNCRTCNHSDVVDDGNWSCTLKRKLLSKAEQVRGCEHYKVLKAFE